MQVLEDRHRIKGELIAAREVLDLRFPAGSTAMSLRAAKLLHFLVRKAAGDAAKEMIHRVSIAELNTFHISKQEFLECCYELFQVTVEVEAPDKNGKPYRQASPLLAYFGHPPDWSGEVAFELSRVLRLVLESSNHWAVLSQRAVMAFKSRYSLRLYEIISARVGLDHIHKEEFSIDDVRALFGVDAGTMLRWPDLRRYVLERAVAEVSHLTGLNVRYEPIKRGRAVIGIRLIWREKAKAERDAAARELDRSSVGREVRRKGTAELITREDTERAEVAAGLRELGGLLAENMRAKY
jgi:hypothetical protein